VRIVPELVAGQNGGSNRVSEGPAARVALFQFVDVGSDRWGGATADGNLGQQQCGDCEPDMEPGRQAAGVYDDPGPEARCRWEDDRAAGYLDGECGWDRSAAADGWEWDEPEAVLGGR